MFSRSLSRKIFWAQIFLVQSLPSPNVFILILPEGCASSELLQTLVKGILKTAFFSAKKPSWIYISPYEFDMNIRGVTSVSNILHLGMNGMNEWTTDSCRGWSRRTTNRCHHFAFVFLKFGRLYLSGPTEYFSHHLTSIFLLQDETSTTNKCDQLAFF